MPTCSTIRRKSYPYLHVVLCPDPPHMCKREGLVFWATSWKVQKRVWCSERLFLSHGAELNGVKNAFPMQCMHTRSHARLPMSSTRSAIWFELSDWGACLGTRLTCSFIPRSTYPPPSFYSRWNFSHSHVEPGNETTWCPGNETVVL